MADDVKNEQKISVNGNEHLVKDLSDEQKRWIKICEDVSLKLTAARIEVEQLEGTSQFFADKIIKSLTEVKEEGKTE